MNWNDVGQYLKDNAGTGLALVGSIMTGNVPGAIAAGAALVADATGTTDPTQALAKLQADPATLVRLEELAVQERDSIRQWQFETLKVQLEDKQHEHRETQETVRGGDKAEDKFVRRTRPGMAWVSLLASIAYVFHSLAPDAFILGTLLTPCFAYIGVRTVDKVGGFVAKVKGNA
jgi:hypothetical protein